MTFPQEPKISGNRKRKKERKKDLKPKINLANIDSPFKFTL